MGRRNKGPKDVLDLMQQREGYRMTKGFEGMHSNDPPFEEDDELPADMELLEMDPYLSDEELEAINDNRLHKNVPPKREPPITK